MGNQEELKKLEERYNGISSELESKESELINLLNDDVVKRYVDLNERVEELKTLKKQAYSSYILQSQLICPHEAYFFRRQFKRRMLYLPELLCLNCGKMYRGFLLEGKPVINEDYIEENDNAYLGDYDEFEELSIKYKQLKEEGLSTEEVCDILKKDIASKREKSSTPFKLIRKKEIR